ncbi:MULTISPECIES: type I methionyl aminopeptidase [Rhodococcus]|uniref:Methionine aminopeptidase n=1 Tax=Rhodococcus oxybenzonivorans TaxID=1990687 RepID=A0AAE5A5U8_9NOCA|nr:MULTISPECIES: type I methionyl aminopeptidase [Rhodococcus]MDV7242998.1 type I methionyl aminopeptidase [Rhodococcus oxybenzonivorans]MDV7264458.1 type I methionyl aminopeptidase [Rhodococcus oxybenzonivorans]MDV7275402.1 type I methionyl aminopeptidase [Rhodococcus oxybenzonivorans]MDV7334743.1 type I methionyl aminopeptidase [Rhodococcus oxybenzonivorans]MDV7344897.1 type I methionyl aminopeptidase [Rhodococcus oxybenzonivorans]
MVELKTAAEVQAMRAAGQVVAAALAAVRKSAAVGVSLLDLDALATDLIVGAGAVPLFRDYHPSWAPSPFPGSLCASVNDAVVHGIPGPYRLRDGDLISVDCGARLDGWCGDAAISFVVGTADLADIALVAATEAALAHGIAAARPGNRLGDIGAAIGLYARGAGYGMLADHGGHGIGRRMHEDPHVPNEGRAGKGLLLRPGMVLAIEPMLIADGSDDYRCDADGWTLRTVTGARAAHSEHTVAIREDGPEVLTR